MNYLEERVDKETRLNWDAPSQSSSGNFLERELIIIAKLHANYQLSMKIYRGFSHFLSWPFSLTCKGNIVLKFIEINILQRQFSSFCQNIFKFHTSMFKMGVEEVHFFSSQTKKKKIFQGRAVFFLNVHFFHCHLQISNFPTLNFSLFLNKLFDSMHLLKLRQQ